MMVAEEAEVVVVVVVVKLVVCGIDGPLDAWGCHFMIFGEVH